MKALKSYTPPLPFPSLQPYLTVGISLIIRQGTRPTGQKVRDAYRLLDAIKTLPRTEQKQVAYYYFDPTTFDPITIPRLPYGIDVIDWLYSLQYFEQEAVWQALIPHVNEQSSHDLIRYLIGIEHPKIFEHCYQISDDFLRQRIALAGYHTAYYLEHEENLEILDALIESGVNLKLAWQSNRKEVQLNLIYRYPNDPRLESLVHSPHEAVRTTLAAKGLFLDQLAQDPSPDIERMLRLRSVLN